MNLDHHFGHIVKKARSEQNMSQSTLAELSNLDRTFISMLERGLRQPSLETVFNISKALGLVPSAVVKEMEALVKKS